MNLLSNLDINEQNTEPRLEFRKQHDTALAYARKIMRCETCVKQFNLKNSHEQCPLKPLIPMMSVISPKDFGGVAWKCKFGCVEWEGEKK